MAILKEIYKVHYIYVKWIIKISVQIELCLSDMGKDSPKEIKVLMGFS